MTSIVNMGATPRSGLIQDNAGNLYGMTLLGGGHSRRGCDGFGCGTAFELVPGNGRWTEKVLHAFSGGEMGVNPRGSWSQTRLETSTAPPQRAVPLGVTTTSAVELFSRLRRNYVEKKTPPTSRGRSIL